jgi:hypothetical protein
MLRENNANGEMLCNNCLETYSACLIGYGSRRPTSFYAHDSSQPHERPPSRRTLAPPLSRTTAQMKPLRHYSSISLPTRHHKAASYWRHLPLLIGMPEELCTDGSVACATMVRHSGGYFEVPCLSAHGVFRLCNLKHNSSRRLPLMTF